MEPNKSPISRVTTCQNENILDIVKAVPSFLGRWFTKYFMEGMLLDQTACLMYLKKIIAHIFKHE